MQNQASENGTYQARLRRALMLVEEAIDILDLAKAPDDIAAHLDLGRSRLESHLGIDD